ncbi:MAG TPA: hypothetical protein VF532_05855 [Candidatus Angelobacter sp.]
MLILYPSNKQLLKVTGLKDENGAFIDNAVITGTLLDKDGNHVAGIDGLAYTAAGSNGNYSATVPATFVPGPGAGYILQLVITVGGVLTDTLNIPAVVQQRAA